MTYTLFIGDKMFSSWSLRGWLMLRTFGIPFESRMVGLYSGTMAQDMAEIAPARLVPALQIPNGDVIGESLAIAETLAERHPEKSLWPTDSTLRARARWLCAEMVGGFTALRTECPMQLSHVNGGFKPNDMVKSDLERLDDIWTAARQLSGSEDGWLFGDISLADIFYAPVAARIIGFNLPVSDSARRYCHNWITDSHFKEWRQDGLKKTYEPFPYPVYAPLNQWPDDQAILSALTFHKRA